VPGDIFETEISDTVSEADWARVGDRVSRPELLRVGQHTIIDRKPIAVRRLWDWYASQGTSSGPLGVCIAYGPSGGRRGSE